MVVFLSVDLVEGCGDDLCGFSDVFSLKHEAMASVTARVSFMVSFHRFPGCLGVSHGLGLLSIGGLPGRASWVGGGVASLAVGALPGFLAVV